MVFGLPPQFGQCSRVRANTRLSNFAQLSRTGRRRSLVFLHRLQDAQFDDGDKREIALCLGTPE